MPPNFGLPNFLQYLQDAQVLICSICQKGIFQGDPTSHLNQHLLNPADRASYVAALGSLHCVSSRTQVHQDLASMGAIRPIPGLGQPKQGVKCLFRGCHAVMTSQEQGRKHIRTHAISGRQQQNHHLRPCYYQSLSPPGYLIEVKPSNLDPLVSTEPATSILSGTTRPIGSPGPLLLSGSTPLGTQDAQGTQGAQDPPTRQYPRVQTIQRARQSNKLLPLLTQSTTRSEVELPTMPTCVRSSTTSFSSDITPIQRRLEPVPDQMVQSLLTSWKKEEATQEEASTISQLQTRDEANAFHLKSRYPEFLNGRDLDQLASLFDLSLPDASLSSQDLTRFLDLITQYILQCGQARISQISRVTAIHLNTFTGQTDRVNIRPIRPLQEAITLTRYARVMTAFLVFLLSSFEYQTIYGETNNQALDNNIPAFHRLYYITLDQTEQLHQLRTLLVGLTKPPKTSSQQDRHTAPIWDDQFLVDSDDEFLLANQPESEGEED